MSNSVISQAEELIPIFSPCDQLYQDYFNLFLTHTNQKSRSWAWFEKEVLPTINHEVMIDLGAGNGELLSHFVPLFRQCIAIEPNPDFRQQLLNLVPPEHYLQTTILEAPDSLPKRDYQLAVGKLQTAKNQRAYQEYQASLEAARRVEEVNQARSSYERQLAEYQQRLGEREFQVAQVKAKLQEVDNAIASLAQVRAAYSGTVRRIKWLGQSPDGSLTAEITFIGKDN